MENRRRCGGMQIAWAALALAASIFAAVNAEAGSRRSWRSAANDVIEDLMFCYARGTDAIGDATSQPNPRDAGYAIYRDCFSDDAVFTAYFPGSGFNQRFHPTEPPPNDMDIVRVLGPEAWADFVNTVFRSAVGGQGYDYTQHVLSNLEVKRYHKHAVVTAYLIASHVATGQCEEVAKGFYTLRVERIKGRWVVTQLDLTLLTFNPLFEAPPGCNPM